MFLIKNYLLTPTYIIQPDYINQLPDEIIKIVIDFLMDDLNDIYHLQISKFY